MILLNVTMSACYCHILEEHCVPRTIGDEELSATITAGHDLASPLHYHNSPDPHLPALSSSITRPEQLSASMVAAVR
jgi:hypothetical protein